MKPAISPERWGIPAAAGAALLTALFALAACGKATPQAPPAPRPSILLVTLDTTRADSIGPDAKGIQTPSFDAVAARGRRYRNAYAAVPETLPSHTSIMTGLYPGGTGIHENGRYVPANVPLLADRLHQAGYRTDAFVSAFVLAKSFGLARGFDLYDDTLPSGAQERGAKATTDAALAALAKPSSQPLFLWVHYYDAHAPYTPPEPFKTTFAANPYLGEIAFVDQQLGRLLDAFQRDAPGPRAVVLVADHGEGLGDHGELQHGNLLYQSTMHVPLVIEGPGIEPSVSDAPVSTRRVYQTILDWAGVQSQLSLRGTDEDVVLGEAMKPFLEYGWQPQVMAVDGRLKAIEAGTIEAYDLASDPGETHNLGGGANLPGGMRKSLDDYPVPSAEQARKPETLDPEAERRLASLGYVGATAAPVVRKDAPRPADMTKLFPIIGEASGLFTDRRYAEAIPLLEKIHAEDPHNLDALLRLATCYSSLGQNAKAEATFEEARAIAPQSQDVRFYLALHYGRTKDWPRAIPMLEQIVKETPDRTTAVEALAALEVRSGNDAMDRGDTQRALAAFERARSVEPGSFDHYLELGVLYLADRRLTDARDALDRVAPGSPGYPMALFKRAQVAVLLNEPDAAMRIEAARKGADATTRPLIEHERLFR